jgi:hypothetical protein
MVDLSGTDAFDAWHRDCRKIAIVASRSKKKYDAAMSAVQLCLATGILAFPRLRLGKLFQKVLAMAGKVSYNREYIKDCGYMPATKLDGCWWRLK